MIRFSIFGIPVTIEPWFWLLVFFIGNGLNLIQQGTFGVAQLGVWAVIVTVSVLVHELGHALTGLKVGGGSAWIKLWGLGGLAYNQGGRFTKSGNLWRIAMGPGAGILFLLFGCILACFIASPAISLEILYMNSIGIVDRDIVLSDELLLFRGEEGGLMKLISIDYFIRVNLLWSLINLLPIYPLDGGQLLNTLHRSPKKVHLIGTVTGLITTILLVILTESMFNGLLFGYLTYMNFNSYKQAQY